MRNDEMQTLIKQLQDRLESLDHLKERRRQTLERMEQEYLASAASPCSEDKSDEFRRRTECNLAEISEKLNRLLGTSDQA